jgi:hypothetical protein
MESQRLALTVAILGEAQRRSRTLVDIPEDLAEFGAEKLRELRRMHYDHKEAERFGRQLRGDAAV